MELSEEKKRTYIRRLLLSRTRLLCTNSFYGLLLMHITYALDKSCETACTDGTRICFSPAFLDNLSDKELDFVMMHEITHVALQHCLRRGNRDSEIYNIACDIVVNSNILLSCNRDLSSITLKKYGVSIHLAPNGREGYQYTVEQVYDMLNRTKNHINGIDPLQGSDETGLHLYNGITIPCNRNNNKTDFGGRDKATDTEGVWDDHSRWDTAKENEALRDICTKHLMDACETITIHNSSNRRGTLPAFADRLYKELRRPQTDWRTVLNAFIHREVNDYSFAPPDRRFDDSPFFLPDWNEKEDTVEDILFMIDTSGSMSDDMVTTAYSEVKGAIDQFNGRLKGWLGFFDADVVPPKPFEAEEEFRIIQPKGGGGTNFKIIFEYIFYHMQEKPPSAILILSDGYAPFPKEDVTRRIPVLWLLNNNDITPPWGTVVRIPSE